MDIFELINAIKNASRDNNITVNITVNDASKIGDEPATGSNCSEETVEETPDTDFTVGQAVLVCHTRHNGEGVKTLGIVDAVLCKDAIGWYTRVSGNNGKHYRAGLLYNEERLGTVIYNIDD